MSTTLLMIAFALLLVAHGIAHLVGFVVPWGFATGPDLANRTTVLAGAIDIGASGMRFLGLTWLALATAFITAGGFVLAGRPANAWIVGLSAVSLVLCIVAWPGTRIGAIVNLAIIAGVLVAPLFSGLWP